MTGDEMMRKTLSLKLQVTLLSILFVTGLVSAFSWNIARTESSIIRGELIEKIILLGRNLALSYSKPIDLFNGENIELHTPPV